MGEMGFGPHIQGKSNELEVDTSNGEISWV